MSNVRIFKVDWYSGAPIITGGGYQLAYQGDDMSNMVIFDKAPNLDNYYLLVKMKLDEADTEPTVLPYIRLEGPYWVVPNYYTQIAQTITFQCCCRTPQGDYEHHSALFTGAILPTIKHNGDPIDQSPMFDPYIDILDKRVNELVVAAGDVVIDSELNENSGNPVQNKVVARSVADLNGRLTQQGTNIGDLSQLNTEDKADLVSAINEAATKGASVQHQLDILYLYGDESEIETNWANRDKAKMKFAYAFHSVDKRKQKYGWCKLSLQGNQTLEYPKHNFNIQFFKDAGHTVKDKTDYLDLTDDKHPKWTIKANYNDYSHARNIVSARLWGDIVHSRPNMRTELSDAPNHGAVNGHPVILYMNGRYYGLYMFNMSKSDWMLGIDEDNPAHCAVSASLATSATRWESVGLNGWELEIPDEWQSVDIDGVTTSVRAGFEALESFVINSTDEEFYANLGNYIDVASAIDYLIFNYCICNVDSMNKNQFLVTWDAGKTWMFTAYDMDHAWATTMTQVVGYDYDLLTNKPNAFFTKLIKNFPAEILERYSTLRGSILSYTYMSRELEILFSEFPEGSKELDAERWGNHGFRDFSTLESMQGYTLARLQWCDSHFAKIDPSYVECTGITIDKSSITFSIPGTTQITATPTPANTSDPVTWSSSAPSVASVSDSGLVTAVSNGTATITAKCGEYTATCNVTVAFIQRGTVDYSVDGLNGVNWITDGHAYDVATGEMATSSTASCTEKVHLQDCLYHFTGGSYMQILAWDANGNYLGTTAQKSSAYISARSDYWYAVRDVNAKAGMISATPVNNSARATKSAVVTISEVNGPSGTGVGTFYYLVAPITSKVSGIISATSGVLDFSNLDWIYSDYLVSVKESTNNINYAVNSAITIMVNGSGSDIQLRIATTMYTTKDTMNAYLAQHPITLVFNEP